MKTNNTLSPQDQKLLEEFMAETEVSDEEYAIGLVLPAIGGADK